MAELSFAELLDLLGHDTFTAVCHRPPGGVFQSSVVASENAVTAAYLAQGDIWFSVNPVVGPVRINSGRGTAAEVVRLAAVFADLDVKPGGVASLGVAGEIIEDVSMMLGTRPSAIVLSGHGLQPYWPLTDGPTGGHARALLRRFGRLVAHVAEIRGGRVDPVYDLARVLRVPGTWNYKSDPVAVTGIGDLGRPLTVEELDDALTAYGVVELPGDREEPGGRIISAPVDWQWGRQTCNYAVKMMDGWAGDAPAARHPWLVAQATRIAAAHRHGCFDESGYHGAVGGLVNRFRDLLARGEARKEGFGEIADALAWGQALAAAKTDAELAIEIGGHSHDSLSDLTWAGGGGHPFESSPESVSQAGDELTEEEYFARAVEHAAYRLRIQVAARALLAAEQAGEMPPFDAGTLGEILARPAEPPYRVEGLIPSEGSACIVAMRKTGKTTLNLNLARSLISGEDFLGRFGVRPISGNIGLLNYEVSSATIARWAHEVGIPHDRLCIVNLRGRRNPLGNDDDKERLAGWLRDHDCESLFVDPFGRAYTGVSQIDAGEVGAWLADLDRWARGEVGATDLFLSVHAGWEGERSRGSSALEDWGDTIITLTRKKAGEDDDDSGHRYLRAEGRDVEVEEDQLEFDQITRLVTMTGMGSRRQATVNIRVHSLVPVIARYVDQNPTCSQTNLENNIEGRTVDIRKAAEMAAQLGLITRTRIGQGWSHMPPAPATESHLEAPRPGNPVRRGSLNSVPTLFQTQTGPISTPSHPVPTPSGRGSTDPVPPTIGGGTGDGARSACRNPSHTPLIKSGRWTCRDCDLLA